MARSFSRSSTQKTQARRFSRAYRAAVFWLHILPRRLPHRSCANREPDQVTGKDGDDIQPLFITLDPQRDTLALLRDYVGAIRPRFVALTGSEAEVKRVATAYKVFFRENVAAKFPHLFHWPLCLHLFD